MSETEAAAAFALALEVQYPTYLWEVTLQEVSKGPRILRVVLHGTGYTVTQFVPLSLLTGFSPLDVAWVIGTEVLEYARKEIAPRQTT